MAESGYRHAFGGAIALAYCTLEPRGTRDLDLNVFAAASEAEAVIHRLPAGVSFGSDDIAAAERDGQVRLDCVSLAVFKAYFDRGKDWVDIEAMANRDPAVIELAAATVGKLSGEGDPRRGRLIRIATRA